MRNSASSHSPEGRGSHLAVLGLVIVILGATLAAVMLKPVHLGLDLQGGLEVVLKATPLDGKKLASEDLEKAVEVIRSRVDESGVAESEIRTQGSDQVVVSLPGETNPDQAAREVGSTGQLRFFEWETNVVDDKVFRSAHAALISAQERAEKVLSQAKKSDKQIVRQLYLFDSKQGQVAGPAHDKKQLLEQARDQLDTVDLKKRPDGAKQITDGDKPELPKGWQVLEVPLGEILVFGPVDQMQGNGVTLQEGGKFDRKVGGFALINNDPGLDGDHIRSATAEAGQGGWVVSMIFTGEGGKRFGKVTEKIAKDGALQGAKLRFAIILDDEIKSIPQIDYTEYPTGIKGNQAQISGLDDREEAAQLARFINEGALPVRFEIISMTQISATLGEQSLRQGLYAGFAGIAIVMVYLILFYRVLGVVATLALMAFAFIFYGIIVTIPVTMTLPGIAGMLLTVGVAADANIIIFERIREEYRSGRNVVQSIHVGYRKGFLTILDATAVTLITAALLIVVSVGTVRGFAVLLGIGTLLSIFTAVIFTYALLGTLAATKAFQKPWVIGGSRKRTTVRWKFNWMARRKRFLAGTLTTMSLSIVILLTMGLNLGVDFKSGTRFDVTFNKKATTEQVRDALISVSKSYSNATITEVSDIVDTGKKSGSSFTITVEKLVGGKVDSNVSNKADREQLRQQSSKKAVTESLDSKFGLAEDPAIQTIGPSFGRQILSTAIIAIVLSLILEVLYIWWRFEFTFAIPVLVVLLHDMLLSIGAYALTGREFKATTVAALLTILGYGLYDTIIVFDRIRENIHIMRKSAFRTIVSQSINEVLTRSLNTSFVVMLPTVALFLFGGETLKDFAFALMIGVAVGVSASITIATSVLTLLKEREHTWKRRLEAEQAAQDAGASSSGKAAIDVVEENSSPAGSAL